MSQKNWLITGAGRGFGHIWAKAALDRGDKVAATARDIGDLGGLQERYGDRLLAFKLDVTERAAVFDAIEQVRHKLGRLDVVISNAGYGQMGAIEEVSIDEARANFETNVFGTLNLLQAVLPHLRAQGSGHILPVSSGGGLISLATTGIYSATKFAVEAIAEALSQEVASLGIKITIIEPGAYRTGFAASARQSTQNPVYDEHRQKLAEMLAPEFFGNPEVTAKAILKIVDCEQPPLRLMLGNVLPIIRQIYGQRIDTWEAWDELAKEAQG
ncbi:SDR family NAD(P)-dependent oxidoreductase [Methylobacterium sp. 285MFTsu5.1]|uniref:SDR family NAD(P)-dependent oxidoreductase n=1 Tax=Methylobacterium sp. 285MFTsu5.1 TaxID=1172187 RepID=UPI0009DC062D|nr:SDR family NAD(P)-dependent oxidoreductase [Methylobacterium sp. 285MFTsu5.1]